MTQQELEKKGLTLSENAQRSGLASLSNDDIRLLFLYETWKDGADWYLIEDCQDSQREKMSFQLINCYGYTQEAV